MSEWYVPKFKNFGDIKEVIKEWVIDASGQEEFINGFDLYIIKSNNEYNVMIGNGMTGDYRIASFAPSRYIAEEYAKDFMRKYDTWRKFVNFMKKDMKIDLMKFK